MPSADSHRHGSGPRKGGPRDRGSRDPWPDRLIRPGCSHSVRLGLSNLYILPSGFGWLWLLGCAALYWMGIGGSSGGALLLAYGGTEHWHNVHELQDVPAGYDPSRVTIFESLGIAVEDCAAAAYVYEAMSNK